MAVGGERKPALALARHVAEGAEGFRGGQVLAASDVDARPRLAGLGEGIGYRGLADARLALDGHQPSSAAPRRPERDFEP